MSKHLKALAIARQIARGAVRSPLPLSLATGKQQLRVTSPNRGKVGK